MAAAEVLVPGISLPNQRADFDGGDYTPENTIWGTWDMQVASRADPDRIALSRAGRKSAAVKKARKREAAELAGQLALFASS